MSKNRMSQSARIKKAERHPRPASLVRQETALAMIFAGKALTKRPLLNKNGWGSFQKSAGPACAVGMGALWQSVGAGATEFPPSYLERATGIPKVFWGGVSDAFEDVVHRPETWIRTPTPSDFKLYADGYRVGQIVRESLED